MLGDDLHGVLGDDLLEVGACTCFYSWVKKKKQCLNWLTIVMYFDTDGEQAGLTEIFIWMLAVNKLR